MMWSDNKKLDLIVNVLIFCIALNIFHLGQLILPLICLILFIDRKFKFEVSSKIVFIILCLFALTFFGFSFKLGFYSVMGFCLPMAYYIGQNLNRSEDNIKKLIYIIALGMGVHVLLNMAYDFSIYGTELFRHTSHYDIWTKSEATLTAMAANYMFMIGVIYYVIFKEKKLSIKIGFSLIFVIMMIYNMTIGRRTPILMLGICFVLCFVSDFFIYGGNKKLMRNILIAILGIMLICAFVWVTDFMGIKTRIYYLPFLVKFRTYGFSSGRLEILFDGIKLMPKHLWGGQEISTILDIELHDLWTDIFDYAGVIPFGLMAVYTVIQVTMFVKILRNKKISSSFKVLLTGVFTACFLQAMLEPLMTGSSILLICMVIMFASCDKLSEV